jgi:hypothetical protein
MTNSNTSPAPRPRRGLQRLIARLGVFGFLFFLVKGLLWLLVPGFLVWWGSR